MLRKKLYVSILLIFLAQNIQATTGYFASGYGPTSTGMAGATTTHTRAYANNEAAGDKEYK